MKKYHIRNLKDFVNVPKDRIGKCLQEFETSLEAVRAAIKMTSFDAVKYPEFVWIDDGKKNIKLKFEVEA